MLPSILLVLLLSVSVAAPVNDLVGAAKSRDKEAIRTLLKQRIDVNAAQGDGSTALHWAAHWDDLETADLLIRAGANVNAATDLGVTPLYLAGVNGNSAMIGKLLKAGANPNAVAVTGVSPLMVAARAGSADGVKALLSSGAKANAVESAAGQTALMWAVAKRHPEAVRVLVENGADVLVRTNSSPWLVNVGGPGSGDIPTRPGSVKLGGSTALLFAAWQGCTECARILIDGGANVNDTAADGNSALVLAAHSAQGAVATFLLEKGANPNADGAGYTALHAAILRGDLDLVKALLAHGADPNARLKSGTPMRRQGPDFSFPASWVGVTPFWLAAKYASVDMMRVLVAKGADPKGMSSDGTNSLIAAAGATLRNGGNRAYPPVEESRALETVAYVLELYSEVNSVNQIGNTPLHIAAQRGYRSVVQMLADKGATLGVKNKRGQTPLALAETAARVSIDQQGQIRLKNTAALLRKLGAAD